MKGTGCHLLERDQFQMLQIHVQGINQVQKENVCGKELQEVLSKHAAAFTTGISGYTPPPPTHARPLAHL